MNNEWGNHVSGRHPACRHRRRRRRSRRRRRCRPAAPPARKYFTSFTSFCFCYLFFCLRRFERISLSWLMNKRGKTSGRRLHNSFSFMEGGGEGRGKRGRRGPPGGACRSRRQMAGEASSPNEKSRAAVFESRFQFLIKTTIRVLKSKP